MKLEHGHQYVLGMDVLVAECSQRAWALSWSGFECLITQCSWNTEISMVVVCFVKEPDVTMVVYECIGKGMQLERDAIMVWAWMLW